MKSFCFIAVLSAWMLVLAGCGSVSTRDLQPTVGPAPQVKPAKILVLPFATEDCVWGLEVSSAEEAMIRGDFPNRMAVAAVQELMKIAPSSKVEKVEEGGGWLVQGRLRKVFLPDPAQADSKRKPRVECTVFVFDLSRSRIQPFMTYDIVAKDVVPDPLADSSETAGDPFLSLEARESARLLRESLQDYIKNRVW